MNELESYYYRVEMPKVRQRIAEFKKETGNSGRCKRLSYLYDRLFELDVELKQRYRAYEKSISTDNPYTERALIASYIPELKEEIERIEREINFIVRGSQLKGNGRITPELIEQAKEYPLGNLIEVKKNMALCPFHDDHNPSMLIKNKRFYCFGCNAKGDTIEFLMRRDGLSFKDAVEQLNQ